MEPQNKDSNYVKCPRCGITRNILEAPNCPICAGRSEVRMARPKIEDEQPKGDGKRHWCPSCKELVEPITTKMNGGGYFKLCPTCQTQVQK